MKNIILAFKWSVLFLSLLSLYTNAFAAGNITWSKDVVGSYKGEIWSGGNPIKGTTNFSINNGGTLIGSYTFGSDSGELANCVELNRENVLKCKWIDKYGEGTLTIKFSNRNAKFDGYWTTENNPQIYKWNGKNTDSAMLASEAQRIIEKRKAQLTSEEKRIARKKRGTERWVDQYGSVRYFVAPVGEGGDYAFTQVRIHVDKSNCEGIVLFADGIEAHNANRNIVVKVNGQKVNMRLWGTGAIGMSALPLYAASSSKGKDFILNEFLKKSTVSFIFNSYGTRTKTFSAKGFTKAYNNTVSGCTKEGVAL